MKRTILHINLLLILFRMPGTVAGQSAFPVERIEPDLYSEQVVVITDRNVYASGEPVHFRAYYSVADLLKEHQWSKVLYLEIVNSRNIRVAQGKYELGLRGAAGQVSVPDSVATGTYFIRAYTKWMRNYPASGYGHVPLIIINPYQQGSAESFLQVRESVDHPDSDSLSKPVDHASVPESAIMCSTEKKTYAKREQITLNIQCDDPGISPEGYSLSVVRKACSFTPGSIIPEKQPGRSLLFEEVKYYPESKGLSVSGEVINADNGQAIPFVKIYLSLLGDMPDCYEVLTDRNGKFRSVIPDRANLQDLLITAVPWEDMNMKINIEKEFHDTGVCRLTTEMNEVIKQGIPGGIAKSHHSFLRTLTQDLYILLLEVDIFGLESCQF